MNLVGVTEIGEMLRLTRQRADQLSKGDGFPEPLGEVAAGRIWRREDIEGWAKSAGRPLHGGMSVNIEDIHFSTLSFVAFEVNALLDQGHRADRREVSAHALAGTALDWLRITYQVDLGAAFPDELPLVDEFFQTTAEAVDARRKFGVDEDGLCLLLAYCIEGMQQRDRAAQEGR